MILGWYYCVHLSYKTNILQVENGDFPGRAVDPEEAFVYDAPKKKKLKLQDGKTLDQYDCKFGIKLDLEGDVVMMSDESEISSLNSAEVSDLRQQYDEVIFLSGYFLAIILV